MHSVAADQAECLDRRCRSCHVVTQALLLQLEQ
jgi:hypothetical protein